jgi:hypothetical protein
VSVRPNAKPWTVQEQICDDPASGLSIQFEVVDDPHCPFRLRIFGEALPFGNRDIVFRADGTCDGGGTSVRASKPSWPTKLEDL